MLKRFVAVALLLPLALWAKIPNDDEILMAITDTKGGYYYPDLMLRFEMGDINLTQEHYHHLYYGYLFQSEYKPLESNPQMDNLIVLASKIDPENPNVGTLSDIVSIADQILKRDPFSPKVWNILAYAYGALGDKIKEREAYDRVEKILRTIAESGDGLKEKSPMHIMMFDHALDLISSQERASSKAMIVSRNVEYVPFTEPVIIDEKRIKGYYFDFSRIYKHKPDSVTYKRDRTWQFNNLKPREYR